MKKKQTNEVENQLVKNIELLERNKTNQEDLRSIEGKKPDSKPSEKNDWKEFYCVPGLRG